MSSRLRALPVLVVAGIWLVMASGQEPQSQPSGQDQTPAASAPNAAAPATPPPSAGGQKSSDQSASGQDSSAQSAEDGTDTAAADSSDEGDDEFVPSEQVRPTEEVLFPVNI